MPDPGTERLVEKLRRAVAQHAAPPAAAEERAPPPLDRILGGSWVETEHGPTFVREERFPLAHRHGRFELAALLHPEPADLAPLARLGLGESRPHPSRLGFFDVETTGTSGGAGMLIFLAGLGVFEGDAFLVRQYFLADLAHERAMLDLLARDLRAVDGLVTYNGRAFDVPALQTRSVLARLSFPCGGLPHLDLLHAVRRLFRRRLESCRLLEAEEKLLSLSRRDDVPGWLIPSLYFDYARAGRAAPLRGVLRHNAADILSLVGLLASIAGLFRRDDPDREEALALARWWERERELERAAALYRRALEGFEGTGDWAWIARRQAFLLKRRGEGEAAGRLWSRLWTGGDRLAGLELAKHLEHRSRDHAAAAGVARALLAGAPSAERPALEHRLARLERKAALTPRPTGSP